MPRPPLDKQMLDYIIDDAVDDFQDTIDGVKELARIFKDENLEHIVRELGEYKTYVGNLKRKAQKTYATYPDIRSPELLGLEQAAIEQMKIDKEKAEYEYEKSMRAKPFKSGVYIVQDRSYRFDVPDKTVEFYRHINTYNDYPTLLAQHGYGYQSIAEFLEYNPGWRYIE